LRNHRSPDEVTLAQLVTHFILPSGVDLDVGSVFYWNLRETEQAPGEKDKTKRELEQIPMLIPQGFNLRVKCNTLRDAVGKKMAHVKRGAIKMNFAMDPNDTMRRLKERVADWLNQSGQGTEWTIDRPDSEEIEFSYEFEVIPLVHDVPIRIFLKQTELEVSSSLSWINLSDQLVKKWNLPKGTLLQVMPMIGTVDDQDPDDQSYTVTWEEGKQYWYNIVYDPIKDRKSASKEIMMIDAFDRVDSLVVPINANVYQVRDLWRQSLEIPNDIDVHVQTINSREFYWTLESSRSEVAFTFSAVNLRGNATIYEEPPHFRAEQLSRRLGVKIPPLAVCKEAPRQRHGPIIEYDGEVSQLNHRLLKTHHFSWNLNGTILAAPDANAWWLPYDRNAIMRFGNSVNCKIPHDPNMAEFPDESWPRDVLIRIKTSPEPRPVSTPLPAGGPPKPLTFTPPGSWQGPHLAKLLPQSARQLQDLRTIPLRTVRKR
jgi:hypothetical protein